MSRAIIYFGWAQGGIWYDPSNLQITEMVLRGFDAIKGVKRQDAADGHRIFVITLMEGCTLDELTDLLDQLIILNGLAMQAEVRYCSHGSILGGSLVLDRATWLKMRD